MKKLHPMAIRSRICEKSNSMALPEAEFRKRFRLTKDAFTFILSEIEFNGHLSTAVSPILQLAATLSLLASGGYQHSVGNDFLIGMCQTTVCKIVGDVVNEMETKLCPHFIKNTLLRNIKFHEICDYEHRILAIDSKYGGAAQDSFVWKHSAQRRFLKEAYNPNNMINVWLLGDSGYPLEPWYLTPFSNPKLARAKHGLTLSVDLSNIFDIG